MLRLISLLTVALAVSSSATAQNAADYTPATYDSLEARLRAGDTAVDFLKLRLSYTATEAYNPYDVNRRDRKQRMMQAFFSDENMQAARQAADETLEELYIDIDAHVIAMLSSEALGDTARALFHRMVVRGLVDSIVQTADGQSPESPYVVISTEEEYALLRIFGLSHQSQSLIECRGEPCDAITAIVPDTGEEVMLYFDVSRPFASLNGLLRK